MKEIYRNILDGKKREYRFTDGICDGFFIDGELQNDVRKKYQGRKKTEKWIENIKSAGFKEVPLTKDGDGTVREKGTGVIVKGVKQDQGDPSRLGRPSDWEGDKTVKKALAFVENAKPEYDTIEDGKGKERVVIVSPNVPTVEGLAGHLDIARSTVYDWAKAYPDFSYALEKLLIKQHELLTQLGLIGRFEKSIVKLIMSANHGYAERSRVVEDDAPDEIEEHRNKLNKLFKDIRNEPDSADNADAEADGGEHDAQTTPPEASS